MSIPKIPEEIENYQITKVEIDEFTFDARFWILDPISERLYLLTFGTVLHLSMSRSPEDEGSSLIGSFELEEIEDLEQTAKAMGYGFSKVPREAKYRFMIEGDICLTLLAGWVSLNELTPM